MSKHCLFSPLFLSLGKLVHPCGLKCHLYAPQTHVPDLPLLHSAPSGNGPPSTNPLDSFFSLTPEIQVLSAFGISLPLPCSLSTLPQSFPQPLSSLTRISATASPAARISSHFFAGLSQPSRELFQNHKSDRSEP